MRWAPGLAACGLSACVMVQAGPDPDKPTRWIWGLQSRAGASVVEEDLPLPADNPGTALGFQVDVAYQVAPPFALGLCLDLSLGFHDPGFYPLFGWGFLLRHEVPHLTVSTWGSWYLGHRLIDEDAESHAESGIQLQGPGIGLAALWRISLGAARVVELGPWVHHIWLHSVEDEVGTAEDEDGALARSLTAGLMVQIAFGGLRD